MSGFGSLDSLRGGVDTLVQQMLVGLMNDPASGFQAEKCAPFRKVNSEKGTWISAGADSFFGSADKTFERAPGTPASEIGITMSTGTYSCIEYAAEFPVDLRDSSEMSNSGLVATEIAMQAVVHQLRLRKEQLFATALQATSSWTNTAAAGYVWSDATNAVPLTNIRTGCSTFLKQSGRLPNCLCLEYDNYLELLSHPQTVASIVGSVSSLTTVSHSQLESILLDRYGIKKVIPLTSVKNSAVSGATAVGAFVATHGTATLLYVDESPSPATATALVTYGTRPWEAKSYWDDKRDSQIVKVSSVFQVKPLVPQYGYTITSI